MKWLHTWLDKLTPAMRNRNFRIYFWTQLVSYIGTGVQTLLSSMLVYQITGHSVFWAGVAVSMNFLPNALLCPTFGGVIADKYPIRKTLYITQILGAVQALMLAFIAIHGPQLWQVLWCIAFGAIVSSVDSPARHRLMMDIVPTEHIPSARALNGTLIMSGQAIGGACAGVVFAHCGGYAGGFVLNALSYGAVVFTLHIMSLKPHVHNHERMLAMLQSGARYLLSEKVVLTQLFFAGFFASVGLAYRSMLPAIAKDIYGANGEKAIASIVGCVSAALAFGSVIGTLVISANSQKLGAVLRKMVLNGSLALGISWVLFPSIRLLAFGLPLMFISGIGFAVSFSGLRSAAAQYVKMTRGEMLGRVVGYDFLFFFGGVAISGPIIGKMTDNLGVAMTMRLIGAGVLLVGFYLDKLDRRHKVLHIGAVKV